MALNVSVVGASIPELVAAILVYGQQQNSEIQASWLSIHDVDSKDGRPVIGEGRTATRGGLQKLLAGLDTKASPSRTLFHPRVLAQGEGFMAWWVPPSTRKLWFKCGEIKESSATVSLPGLVFIQNADVERGWSVFALGGKNRPDATTPLLYSPFMNVWDGGAICTGNVKVPASMHPEDYEDAFFNSYFTHPNHRGIFKNMSVYDFWKRHIAGEWKTFPTTRLTPLGKTLGEVFNEKINGGKAS